MQPDIAEATRLTTEPQRLQGEIRAPLEKRPERTGRGLGGRSMLPRPLAAGTRGTRIGDGPLPGDFRTPREVAPDVSDDDEDRVSEMDGDSAYTKEGQSSTERSTTMNANRTPEPPSASPFPATGAQPYQYPAQMWHNGAIWTNNSYNTTTTDTRDSHNDSSINVVDSE